MNEINEIRENLLNTSYLMTQAESLKEAHGLIIKSLVLLEVMELKINSQLKENAPIYNKGKSTNSIENEVKKVARRLKLWVKRQNQINTKILNAYLKLEDQLEGIVTEQALKKEAAVEKFDINFISMSAMSEKGHGKIFESNQGNVKLWEPISSLVYEYKKQLLNSQ